MGNNITPIKQEDNKGFALRPSNMEEAFNFAVRLANSSLAPKNYQGKPDDVLIAMMMGFEVGLNPMQAIQNIATINGRPSIWGDAMLALVQNHPSFKGIQETFDDATMTATCVVQRKGGQPHTVTFSQADAEKAGLWGKPGPWQNYPKRMLKQRARGFALRDQFADALLGLVSAEEAQDMPQEEIDVTPQHQTAMAMLPAYPDDRFQTNFPEWESAIQDGKKTPGQVIATISSKYAISEGQKQMIMQAGENNANS